MMRKRVVVAVLCLWWPVCADGGEIDFAKQIEPIFRQHCFDCHGPDEQEHGFRLDQRAALLRGGDPGEPAVVPGNPTASYLIRLIKGEVVDKQMPPGGRLSAAEVERIEEWIRQGARTPVEYGGDRPLVELRHWSYLPLQRPSDAASIDAIIQRRLAAAGLSPSPRASKRVRIRRLFLVMLGIPPSPEEVKQFVNDSRPGAWERLVDRVLASPHYGERWATYWLDLVRFGETHGFETNRERPNAWRYRDWVIRSFNEDKPYDDFIRQQIAGDALGEPVGTGFLVAGPYDLVKGQDALLQLQQRMNELDDMINTTGTAFLGLTIGCARCHNHKFDPITQRDYYALQAVFAGVQHGDRAVPPSSWQLHRIAALQSTIRDLTNRLRPYEANPSRRGVAGGKELLPPVNAQRNEDRFRPRIARWLRFTIIKSSSAEGCIDELEVFAGDQNVALASSGAIATSSGDFVHPLHKLEHINDGRYGNAHSWIVKSKDGGWVQIEFPRPLQVDRVVWGRDREGKYTDRVPVEYRIEIASEPGQWEVVASSDDRAPQSPGELRQRYRLDQLAGSEATGAQAWLAELEAAQRELSQWQKPALAYAGTFTQPGPTYRLYRGEPTAKREQVGPDTVSALGHLELAVDAPEQQRRLALANWIASPTNPLTPRVIVNRLWQFHFGTGIVDTPSDFGQNGSRPTHPELLDFLACELIDHDWSLKHIHRLILLSDTWQQSSRPRADALRQDAASRLLWRFPPRRLNAEAIRDSILFASGVLDRSHVGGPGFSAFEVEAENVRHYHPKETYGPADWRRMIYMIKVRQEKDDVFGVFDCPDASMTVPKRSRSTTPLQALSLLNSRFVLQQAELFAERLNRECDSPAARVTRAWQICFQRDPTRVELEDSIAFIERYGLLPFTRALFNANEFVFIP